MIARPAVWRVWLVPGRGGTWSDVAIDGLGISLAALFAWHTLVRPTTRGSAPNP
jgi:hypothetical protein